MHFSALHHPTYAVRCAVRTAHAYRGADWDLYSDCMTNLRLQADVDRHAAPATAQGLG